MNLKVYFGLLTKKFTRILPIINMDNALIMLKYCIINSCCKKEDRNLKNYKG